MRWSVLSLSFAVFLVLVSCGGQNARRFNDSIVELKSSLEQPVAEAEGRISEFAEVPQWDSIAAVSARMQAAVQDRIDQLNAMKTPDIPKATDFKRESLRYFTYLKDLYAGYNKVGVQATDQARATEAEKFKKLVQVKDQAFQSFAKSQQEFAKANDLRLENKQ